MTDTDGVLAAIDACLDDMDVSEDAMRWAPDEPDSTPKRSPFAEHLAQFVEHYSDFRMPVWQRHYLNAVIPAVEVAADLPARDGLLRINMPDSSESFHRVLSVTPGESLGEYWLTIEPAVTVFTEAADRLRRAAETALEGFGKAFGPVLSATQAALHRGTYEGDRKHFRRCPTCNPAGFPKGMSIDRADYHRRQRSRSRR